MNSPKNNKDISVIPKGIYCHGPIIQDKQNPSKLLCPKMCPYWKKLPNKPIQANGYCEYLGLGDGDTLPGCKNGKGKPYEIFLLWDQVKYCNINDDYE